MWKWSRQDERDRDRVWEGEREERPPTRPLDDALYLSLSPLLCVSVCLCICVCMCVMNYVQRGHCEVLGGAAALR